MFKGLHLLSLAAAMLVPTAHGAELPVPLQNATATFSQSADGHGVGTMINGTVIDNRGWGIHPHIANQTAVVETKENLGTGGPTELRIQLVFDVKSVPGTTGHTLGRFRLSVTSDPRGEFANGLESGGDVTTNWTVLDISSATSQAGAVLTELPDGSILVSGTLQEEDVYTLNTTTEVTGITGFRLEALTHESLAHGGPGREPINGNFHVSEMIVKMVGAGPEITEQPQSASVELGGNVELGVAAQSAFPLGYQWHLNGAPLLNKTNASLAIVEAAFANGGTYTVVVTAAGDSLVSEPAIVQVTPPDANTAAAFKVSNQTPATAPILALNQALLSGTRYLAQVYAGTSAAGLQAVSAAVPFLSGEDAGYFAPIDVFLGDVEPGATVHAQVRVWDSVHGGTFEAASANDGQRRGSAVLTVGTGGNGLPVPELAGLTGFSLERLPQIVAQPAGKTVLAGEDATFEVEGFGSSQLTYQWRFNGNDLPGATASVLTIANAQPSASGLYSVVVANQLGFIVSDAVDLEVDTRVDVMLANATATYSQVSDGHGVDKMINGTISDNRGWGIHPNITNQTAVVETVENVGFAGGTMLTIDLAFAVKSVAGTTGHTLGRFRLSATTDDRAEFADGLQIGGDVTANWTVLEVVSAVSLKGASIIKLEDGSLLVSGPPEVEDVYTVVAATDLTGITGLRLEALADESLPHGGPGREELNGNFHVSEFTVIARAGRPRIVDQPDSKTVEIGGTATFGVEVSSTLTSTYQWFFEGVAVPGETNSTLVVEDAQPGDGGVYWVEVSNIEGTVASNGALLTVLPQGSSGWAAFKVSNAAPASAPVSSARGALLEGLRYRAQVYAGADPQALAAVSPAVPFLAGPQAGFFLPMEIFLAEPAAGATVHAQVLVWDSAAGATYEAAIANGGERGASSVLPVVTGGNGTPVPDLTGLTAFSLETPPIILAQPADAEALVGESVTFEVEVFATGTVTYQWKFNGAAIEGATESSLVLTNVQTTAAGNYTAEVQNALGTVTSAAAALVVEIGPAVTLVSPAAGNTYAEHIILAGTITDDLGIASARWERNGLPGGTIALVDGNFSTGNLGLVRGDNRFRVIAVDTSGNEGSAEVIVTQVASRAVFVGEIPSHQEGARVGVPIYLSSLGGVGGADFALRFMRNDLVYIETEWDEALGGGIKQLNPTLNEIRANFALSGTAIAEGTQRIATVYFRALSVNRTIQSALPLLLQGIYSDSGDPLSNEGTEVRAGSVEITQRKHVGDNNANDRLDVGDASAIMRIVSRLDPPRIGDVPNNDLNQNSQVDSGDVVKVLRVVVGLDPQPEEPSPPAAPPGLANAPMAAAENPKRIALLMEEGELNGKAVLLVKVNVEGMTKPLSGASFRLQYPADALRLEGAPSHTAGALVPANAAVIWNVAPSQNNYATQNGTVSLAVSSESNWQTNNGTLAEFVFAVQEPADTRYRWPISVQQVELASNFELISAAPVDAYYVTRTPVAAALQAGAALSEEGIRISLTGELGERYLIEISNDLREWVELTTVLNTSGVIEFTDEAEEGTNQQFYRATQLE